MPPGDPVYDDLQARLEKAEQRIIDKEKNRPWIEIAREEGMERLRRQLVDEGDARFKEIFGYNIHEGDPGHDGGDPEGATWEGDSTQLERAGRDEDSFIGHLAQGETVVPSGVLKKKADRDRLRSLFEEDGLDIEQYTVGNEDNQINPETGYPEFRHNRKQSAKETARRAKLGAQGRADDSMAKLNAKYPARKLKRGGISGTQYRARYAKAKALIAATLKKELFEEKYTSKASEKRREVVSKKYKDVSKKSLEKQIQPLLQKKQRFDKAKAARDRTANRSLRQRHYRIMKAASLSTKEKEKLEELQFAADPKGIGKREYKSLPILKKTGKEQILTGVDLKRWREGGGDVGMTGGRGLKRLESYEAKITAKSRAKMRADPSVTWDEAVKESQKEDMARRARNRRSRGGITSFMKKVMKPVEKVVTEVVEPVVKPVMRIPTKIPKAAADVITTVAKPVVKKAVTPVARTVARKVVKPIAKPVVKVAKVAVEPVLEEVSEVIKKVPKAASDVVTTVAKPVTKKAVTPVARFAARKIIQPIAKPIVKVAKKVVEPVLEEISEVVTKIPKAAADVVISVAKPATKAVKVITGEYLREKAERDAAKAQRAADAAAAKEAARRQKEIDDQIAAYEAKMAAERAAFLKLSKEKQRKLRADMMVSRRKHQLKISELGKTGMRVTGIVDERGSIPLPTTSRGKSAWRRRKRQSIRLKRRMK